jgi:hypothetical protein
VRRQKTGRVQPVQPLCRESSMRCLQPVRRYESLGLQSVQSLCGQKGLGM